MLATLKGKVAAFLTFLFQQRQTRRMLAALLFFAVITTLISIEFMPNRVNLKVGQVSPENIRAPRTITFEDKVKTEELRREAAARVEDQYDFDPGVSPAVQRDISAVIAGISEVQADSEAGRDARVARLRQLLPFSLPEETLGVLIQPSPRTLQQLEQSVNGLIAQALEGKEGVTPENLEAVRNSLLEKMDQLPFNKAYQELGRNLIKTYLRPNKFFNPERTRLLKEAAMAAVPPQQVTIWKDEMIVRVGDVVKAEQMAKLEALGLTQAPIPWRVLIGNGLLVVLLMAVVLFYLFQQNKEIFRNAGHLYLIGIIVIVVMIVAKGIIAIDITQWPELSALFGYMVPMAAAGMLIAILLDSRLAVLIVAVMSFLLMLMTDGQLRFGVVGLVGGITGVYTVSRLSQRGDLARAGVYTSLANITAIMIMELIQTSSASLIIASAVIFGVGNGFLSAILTIGLLPYLESTFKITSSVRLLELSHPGSPLLKRLLTEAPGTYHHSIVVGNLAEAAAEAIGAESLLTRVGAYYHDIGKLKRPYFFIENQLNQDNPHDKIAPTLSTLILTSHVKDGVELAKEYKLPPIIIDIIEQHHGSSLCTFFYLKALENGQNEGAVNEEEFRYEGPKPKTKEAALVMLADSVEAGVRSLQNRTPGRVEGMVRKIIKDKLMDGQLDECDLTFKDLDTIASAFLQVLSGIFHARIEYPDLSKEIERRKTKGAGLRKQPARSVIRR
ncbi:MAG: HDIG domain-containing protein [Armatimonadetes bacterium]|nr:HDIG domain-containing protein [Armatimonadota bacterium]